MLEDDEKYFQSTRFKRLLERYETAMEQSGNIYLEPDELTDIAEHYAMENRMDDANRAIKLALALHPGSVDPQVFLSRQQMFKGDIDKAYEIADAITDQEDREVLFLRTELLLYEERDTEAYKLVDHTYREMPDDEEPDMFLYDAAALFYDYSAWPEALRLLEELRNNFQPMQKAERLYIGALLEMGHAKKAATLADAYLEENPYDALIWTVKGEAIAALGDLEQANEAADFALAINPSEPRALVLSGNCNFHLGNYPEALEAFTQYLKDYPNEQTARYMRSLTFSVLDRLEEAAKEAELLDMEDPSLENMREAIYMHRALTLAKLGRLEEALTFEELYEQEAHQDDAVAYCKMQRGFIYLYCNRIEEAMDYLRQGLRDMPSLQTALDAPLQLIEHDRVNEAIELLNLMDQLYQHDPAREQIMPMLAHCYYQTENRIAFLSTFRRALENEPELTANVFRLELPPTNDQQERYRQACLQIFGREFGANDQTTCASQTS